MKQLLLGIDVGTYSSKATLTALDGTVLRTAAVPHDIRIPQPGHVEQDADAVWWHGLCALCRMIFASGPYTPGDVAGVAVSAIGPCLLPLDAAMRPLRAGILYGVDTRATAQIAAMQARLGQQAIFQHSRMDLTSQAIGPKIAWLKEHEPEVWARTAKLTTASSYLVYRLTGEHRIDHHTASHYMPLYNPASGTWDDALGSGLLPDMGWLPALGWCDEVAGHVTPQAALECGLQAGTPVAVGAVDALSEAISVGVVEPGDLMVMYGSTTFFVLVQNQPTPDPRVWTVAGAWPGQYNLAAGMGTTGSLTRWFRDEMARDLPDADAYPQLFADAAAVAPGAHGLLVLPYFSGERTPINDPLARGVIAGLDLSHRREHVFRALLEGVGFGVRHNLETFAALGAPVRRMVAVGGGAQTDVWLQIVSDIAGVEQIVPRTTIGASYGNAFLAGCAAGAIGRADIAAWVREGHRIQPNRQHQARYDTLFAQYLALYRGTRDVMHQLAVLT